MCQYLATAGLVQTTFYCNRGKHAEVCNPWIPWSILFPASLLFVYNSASARISKGQGYQGFSRKMARSSFGKKGQFASYKEKL
jgi:hypothetical protein